MEMIILSRLRHVPSSAYDVTVFIHQETGLYISLGMVYSTLYFLERQGFVKGKSTLNNRLYFVTLEGTDYLEKTLRGQDEMVRFIKNILQGSNSTGDVAVYDGKIQRKKRLSKKVYDIVDKPAFYGRYDRY